MAKPNKNKKKPQTPIPMLELLAFNAIGPARQLLKKHGKEDASNEKDLQAKLENLHATSTDKLALEKEFAEIHPHKDFILKYLTPEPAPAVKTTVTIPEAISAAEGVPAGIEPLRVNTEFLISAVAIVAIAGLVIYSTK
jgi:hypothetical protein